MSAVLLLARFFLALVFAVAATGKLADREGALRAVHEFGVSARLVRPLGLLIPLAEVGIAAGLASGASARAAAAAAVALLAIFSVAVAAALVRGRRPDCHCFGRLHSAPASGRTLARNGALAAIATLVALRPAAEPGWIELAIGCIAALVAAQAWLCFELLRRHGRALRRIEELEAGVPGPVPLEVGSQAPPFVLPDLDGRWVALETLLEKSQGVLLLFSDPGCSACDAVLGEANGRGADVVVISAGEPREVVAKALSYGLDAVLIDERREVSMLFGVAAVPTAVLVDADGRIDGDLAVGASEVAELMRAASSTPPRPFEETSLPALTGAGAGAE